MTSTKTIILSDGEMVWRKVGELPSARSGFGGANVDELFHVAGGRDISFAILFLLNYGIRYGRKL